LIRYRPVREFAAICFLCVAGCTSRPSHHEEPRHYGPKINIEDFMRNTANYKGRIITLAVKVDTANDRGQRNSLRDYIGQDVAFVSTGPQGGRLRVVIRIPEGISLPEIESSQEVSITFICTRGMLKQGNEAKIVEKPKT
jgi:hypothetical protein